MLSSALEACMRRVGLTDFPREEMLEHIRSGRENRDILNRQRDRKAAYQETFDEADVVYAVWAGWNDGEASSCGCSLAIVKGADWLDAHGNDEFSAKTITIYFDTPRDARESSWFYGDNKGKPAS